MRGRVPNFVSVVIVHFLIFSAFVLFYHGILLFFRSPRTTRFLWISIAVSLVLLTYFSTVCDLIPIPSGVESGPAPVEALNAALEADKEEMQQLVQNEPGLNALTPNVVVAYSEAVDLINRVSKEEKADLIVVGSHGASGLERLVLGSVAEAVMRQATCPVMIVGPKCKPEQHPFRSILFATDLKTTGLRGAQYAAALAERFHGKLTALHVMNRNFKDDGQHELFRNSIPQELAQLFPPDVEQYCRTRVLLEYGKLAETITSIAKVECASMIVIGFHDRALADHAAWSTLSYVIREANCPVLGVRSHVI